MHQRKPLILVLLTLLLTGCHGSSTSSQNHAATAQGSPSGAARSGASSGGGSGEAVRVNFTEAVKSARAGSKAPTRPEGFEFDRREYLRELPSVPTTGTRRQAANSGSSTPRTSRILPCVVAALPCPFDAVAQDNCTTCGGSPPDPNAAVGAGKIVEVVNDLMKVTNRLGAVQCGGAMTLQKLLGNTTDNLTDPRVLFDDVNQRFSFSVTVSQGSITASSIPAMWVATSETDDPCGNWFLYRLTFHGDFYPNGTFLDFPMLGQDTNALFISIRGFGTNGTVFTIFGMPKSIMYAGTHVEFNSFHVDSLTAPVINAGNPMIASPVSFFLAAVPGTGYKLYRLTNSGGAGASLTNTTIPAPFSKPSRAVNQPGTTATLDPSDGNITGAPYFDGSLIWFAHDGDDDGFPTVRYGAVDTRSNTVATVWAFHSGNSDDFNPSIAVGISPLGETVYLNWAFTDTLAGKATTPVFSSGDASQPIGAIAGAGTIYASGGGVTPQCTDNSTTPPKNIACRFGDFSSVSVDPTVSGCAFATQQYFGTDMNWKTRIAPIGKCESVVVANPR
jgi:hypothetical protein